MLAILIFGYGSDKLAALIFFCFSLSLFEYAFDVCLMRGLDWHARHLDVCDLGTATTTGSTATATALSSEVASSILAARTVTIEAATATA